MKEIAAVVCALVLLAGCGPAARGPAKSNYYPLGTGSRWQYSVYYVDSTGRKPTGSARQRNEVWVAGSATLASGETAAVVVTRMDQPYVTFETSYARNTGACVVSCLKVDSKLRDTVLVLPPEAGKAWHRLVGGEPRIAVNFAGQETVMVRAGTYCAWRADEVLDSSSLRNSAWYAPGVGMVKTEIGLTSDARLIVELESATVK